MEEDVDSRPTCPECDVPCISDWYGDPDVIGGTRSFYVCPECGHEPVDKDSPLAVTEQLFAFAWKNGRRE